MEKEKIGLLVMAYGTPYELSDVKRYYTHIRRGNEPSEEDLQDLIEKYEAIGGVSPFARITEAQAKALEEHLNTNQSDYEFQMYLGLRHIEPFIEDAVQKMAEDGLTKAATIYLAPHYSNYSIEGYNKRAQKEAEKHDIKLKSVEYWYDEPDFIQFWAEGIESIYDGLTSEEKDKTMTIFSAHSLPKRALTSDDPYVKQLQATADLIAEKANIPNYEIAWQSEGNTPDPWLEPDVLDLTRELYKNKGFTSFVYAPVGFVSDHLEILYDNDYECKEVCDELGAKYFRPEMPNTDPRFIEAMAKAVLSTMQK